MNLLACTSASLSFLGSNTKGGRLSSNKTVKDLFPAGCFRGDSPITVDPVTESSSRAGKSIFGWELVRCFFSLFGDGETGSPRKRFRALEIAEVFRIGDNGAVGCVEEDGSVGEFREIRLGAGFVGVEKGFCGGMRGGSALSFPLFFTGENGLNVASGAVVSAARETEGSNADFLGGVEGADAAAACFARRL